MDNLSREIAQFVGATTFEDLPEPAVHEVKRIILDSIGCGLAGIKNDKGKIAVQFAMRLGGTPESSILGGGEKVSCCNAAFANGELINARDHDCYFSTFGQIAAYVLPAHLAVAESVSASGRDLILATALGHEIAARVAGALSVQSELVTEGTQQPHVGRTPTHGHGQCIFGAAVGAGKLLGLDPGQLVNALGIAGYFCAVPSQRKWEETAPSSMAKYGSGGWVAMGGVTSSLLAQMGYVGDATLFEGDYGFWRFWASERWEPAVVTEGLGKEWLFVETGYKPYPCCPFIHGSLDCLKSLMDRHHLKPEEMERVDAFSHPMLGWPVLQNTELASQVDAELSARYLLSCVAHGVGHDHWQDWETMRDQSILAFMDKVSCLAHPRFAEIISRDPASFFFSAVEVAARGERFSEEQRYLWGAPHTLLAATDEELRKRFEHNASTVLTRAKIDRAVECLVKLEELEDVGELMQQVSSR